MRRRRLVVVDRCVVDDTQLKPRSAASRAVLSMQALVVTPMITRLEMPRYGRYGSKSELLKALQGALADHDVSRLWGDLAADLVRRVAGPEDAGYPGPGLKVKQRAAESWRQVAVVLVVRTRGSGEAEPGKGRWRR